MNIALIGLLVPVFILLALSGYADVASHRSFLTHLEKAIAAVEPCA